MPVQASEEVQEHEFFIDLGKMQHKEFGEYVGRLMRMADLLMGSVLDNIDDCPPAVVDAARAFAEAVIML